MKPADAIGRLSDVPLEIRVQIDALPLKIRELLRLRAGSVVRTGRPAGDDLDIFIGGHRVGSGEIVAAAGKLMVQVTSLAARG